MTTSTANQGSKTRTAVATGVGGLGGAAVATVILRNANDVSKLLESLAHLTESQASLLIGTLIFIVFLGLIIYLIRGMVDRRESEVTSYKDMAATFEKLVRERFAGIKENARWPA